MRGPDEWRIETPEQIGLDLELAGLGSRFVAQLIDWILKAAAAAVLLLLAVIVLALAGASGVLDEPSLVLFGGVVAAVYLLALGYGVYFEVRWNGQTPGKRAAGIRAVREGGGPLDVTAAGVRNLLGMVDVPVVLPLLGPLLILLTAKRQRLGDLAAGTIVVRERVAELGADPGRASNEYASPDYRFTAAHLAPLAAADRGVLGEFLRRQAGMTPDGRERLAVGMADTYARKIAWPRPPEGWYGDAAVTFLASLLRDLDEHRRHG